MIDIVIGDGHRLFVDLLSSVLVERGFGSVDSVDGGEQLVTCVRRRRPRLCLVDHRSLAGRHGGRLLEDLVSAGAGRTRIVVVSAGPTGPAADTAGALGVDGVLDKRASLQVLLDGVSRVLAGEVLTAAPVLSAQPTGEDAAWIRHLAENLTPRERECLALLVEGRTTRQIERSLSISVTTVRSHVRSLLGKLNAHSRLEAAALAVRYELLGDDAGTSRAG